MRRVFITHLLINLKFQYHLFDFGFEEPFDLLDCFDCCFEGAFAAAFGFGLDFGFDELLGLLDCCFEGAFA